MLVFFFFFFYGIPCQCLCRSMLSSESNRKLLKLYPFENMIKNKDECVTIYHNPILTWSSKCIRNILARRIEKFKVFAWDRNSYLTQDWLKIVCIHCIVCIGAHIYICHQVTFFQTMMS